MMEGDERRERGAARAAKSAVDLVVDERKATNEEDCDASAECRGRDAEICRAIAVSEKTSRVSFHKNKRRASEGE